ncbi:MAG TPA: hypothetical protein VFZ81_07280, partial [Burkholderiales bacterium]
DLSATSQVSPLCPPGTGHACGCGNLSACDGRSKAIAVAAPAAQPAARPAFLPLQLPRPGAPRSRLRHAPASPRAPPLFLLIG